MCQFKKSLTRLLQNLCVIGDSEIASEIEFQKEVLRLQKEKIEQVCDFNINRLTMLNRFIEEHSTQINRIKKLFESFK